MAELFLLRGAPGSGKSTWVAENGFLDICVSSDDVRVELMGLETDLMGFLHIPQRRQKEVWETVHDRVKALLDGFGVAIVDSCARNRKAMRAFSDLVETATIVDFTDVAEEVAIERNACREGFRQVPEEVIRNYYSRLGTVPDGFSVMCPEDAAKAIKGIHSKGADL